MSKKKKLICIASDETKSNQTDRVLLSSLADPRTVHSFSDQYSFFQWNIEENHP